MSTGAPSRGTSVPRSALSVTAYRHARGPGPFRRGSVNRRLGQGSRWLSALSLAASLTACHCNTIDVDSCYCGDGTCQLAEAACGGAMPACDSICQGHGGAESSSPEEGFCPTDGGIGFGSVDGGLQGPHAFAVVGSWMSADHPQAACGAVADVLKDGGIAAVGIELYSEIPSGDACANDGGNVSGLSIEIVLGTSQFIDANVERDGGPLTQALSPGVYILENEDVSDQNLCMISPLADAVMTEFLYSSSGQGMPLYNGVGTVNIDQFSNGTLSGSLDAWLVSVDGTPGVDGGPLTGNFSASVCP